MLKNKANSILGYQYCCFLSVSILSHINGTFSKDTLFWVSYALFGFVFKVRGPPLAGAFKERPTKPTMFRKCYERGDFPIALEHDTKGNKIAWKVSRVTAS